MRPPDDVKRRLVKEWLGKAENEAREMLRLATRVGERILASLELERGT